MSGSTTESALGEDWFKELRSDDELARLVMDVVASVPRPFGRLWSELVGASSDIEEVDARALWSAAVAGALAHRT